MYHMIIEQTKEYSKRMIYQPDTNTFIQSEKDSLTYAKNFFKPYGWIKESGTPPLPHWDVILMSDDNYELGDELEIKIIGVFLRNDRDNKYVAVKTDRNIGDLFELSPCELDDLKRLYSCINNKEGWFGREIALKCLSECGKSL